MKAETCLVVFGYILFLVGSSLPIVNSSQNSATSDLEYRLSRIADWIYAQYNPSLGLVRDSPTTAPDTYWLMSCNFFSSLALRDYYPEISQEIYSQLLKWGRWQVFHNLYFALTLRHDHLEPFQLDDYLKLLIWGYTWDNLHEAIVGKTIPFPIRVVRTIPVHQGTNYTIMTLMFDSQTIHSDYEKYFDLLIYLALNEFWMGNRLHASELFNQASRMWDGTGIIDEWTRVTELELGTRVYATMKLALLLYASRILEIPLPDKEQIENILWSMQQSDGGIATIYYSDGAPFTTESNTETAPLVIIAYKCIPRYA